MKKGNIMRDVISSSQFTANVIKEYKKGLSCNSWGIKFSQFPSCIYLC
jgi:hypothetical protein